MIRYLQCTPSGFVLWNPLVRLLRPLSTSRLPSLPPPPSDDSPEDDDPASSRDAVNGSAAAIDAGPARRAHGQPRHGALPPCCARLRLTSDGRPSRRRPSRHAPDSIADAPIASAAARDRPRFVLCRAIGLKTETIALPDQNLMVTQEL